MLSKRLEEAKVAEVMVPNEVQIVDAPTLPEKAIAPRRVLVMVASAIIGLILGCLYTLVNSLRNRRIQTAKDVEDMLQVPMLGVIPKLAASNAFSILEINDLSQGSITKSLASGADTVPI